MVLYRSKTLFVCKSVITCPDLENPIVFELRRVHKERKLQSKYGGLNSYKKGGEMGFLKHRGRVLIEFVGLMYGAFMTFLAIIEWAGRYSWRLAPSSLLLMAGIALLVVIYLVLDEIRLNTQH